MTRQIVTLDDGTFEAHIQSAPPGAALSLFDSSGTVPIGPTGVTDVSFTVCGQRSVTLVLGAPTGGAFQVSLSVA